MPAKRGIEFDRKSMASVTWVRKHRKVLYESGFSEALFTEAARYVDEHNLDYHGAGHAAINNIGRSYHDRIRRLLVGREHTDTTKATFLTHLRHWFDFEGVEWLKERYEDQEE